MTGKISTLETHARRATSGSAQQTRGTPPTRRGPSRRARAALVADGSVLGLAAAEIGARLVDFEFRPHMRNRVYFAEPDPLVGWRNRPAMSGPYGGDEFLTWVTHNAAGQRGPEHALARTPGRLRVAILGDSQAWGDGVADDETFAARLAAAGGERIEAINFASPGYGTDQQLLVFEHRAAAYRPDVVVIAVFLGNDLQDNLSAGTYQYPKPYFTADAAGELTLHGVPVESPRLLHVGVEIYRAVMRRSALLNALGAATAETPPAFVPNHRLPAEPRVYRTLYAREPDARERAGLDLTARLLAEIARQARAVGARPIVLVLPELWQVDVANRPDWRRVLRAEGADWRRPQKVLRRALEAEGVEVIDALPALARASRHARTQDEHAYYRGWRHLTAAGHRTVGRILAARLGAGGLREDAAAPPLAAPDATAR